MYDPTRYKIVKKAYNMIDTVGANSFPSFLYTNTLAITFLYFYFVALFKKQILLSFYLLVFLWKYFILYKKKLNKKNNC